MCKYQSLPSTFLLKHRYVAFNYFIPIFQLYFRTIPAEDIVEMFRTHVGTAMIVETVLAGIYALFAILMIAGVKSRVRCLMVPYLVYQERNLIIQHRIIREMNL